MFKDCCGTTRASCACVRAGSPADWTLKGRRPTREDVDGEARSPRGRELPRGDLDRRPTGLPLPLPGPDPSGERSEVRDGLEATLDIVVAPALVEYLEEAGAASPVLESANHWKALTFRPGDPVEFFVIVDNPAGEDPDNPDPAILDLHFWVFRDDDFTDVVRDIALSTSMPPDGGTQVIHWTSPPHDQLGFYRVVVASQPWDGWQPGDPFPTPAVQLPATGTRPANHFTYAVVPDPEWRDAEAPAVERTFFGLHSTYQGFSLLPWLGVRWVNHPSYPWASHTNPSSRLNWAPGDQGWAGGWPTGEPWSNLPPPAGAGDGPEYLPRRVAPYYWWMDPAAQDSGSPDWSLPGSWLVEEAIGDLGAWGIYPLPTLYEMGVAADGSWWTLNDAWDAAGPGQEITYGDVDAPNQIARLEPGDGVRAWAGYCFRAARKLAAEYGGMEHRLYRITAEPIPWRKYRGEVVSATPDEDSIWFWLVNSVDQASAIEGLAEVYEIAARQIHAADPVGRVIGPTMENLLVGNMESHWDEFPLGKRIGWYTLNQAEPPEEVYRNSPYFNTEDLLYRTGPNLSTPPIVESLDGFALHPYVWRGGNLPLFEDNGILPADVDGLIIDELRKIKTGLPPDMPLYATEFGFNTNSAAGNRDTGRDQSGHDLDQARLLIRQNLILLGEGFSQGISFNTRDNDRGEAVRQYGLYYNLEDNPADPDYLAPRPTMLGPRPVAPAYAAMTWLLEGFVAKQSWTEELQEALEVLAYAYTQGAEVILALWDPADSGQALDISELLPTSFGASSVLWTGPVYDWMGNELSPDVAGYEMEVSAEPVYVRGVRLPSSLRSAPGRR